MTLIKIDPNKKENIIHDRVNSMLDKVKRTGTSQDPEEFVTFSNETIYKGFACLIAKCPIKGVGFRYKGLASEIQSNEFVVLLNEKLTKFETPYTKDLTLAGRTLYKFIDIYRKKKK